MLRVNKKASSTGCGAEMGCFPVKIDIDMKILKYWIHLDFLEDSNFVKHAFIMSKTLNDTGHKSFHSCIRGLLDKVGRPMLDYAEDYVRFVAVNWSTKIGFIATKQY